MVFAASPGSNSQALVHRARVPSDNLCLNFIMDRAASLDPNLSILINLPTLGALEDP